MDEKKVPFWRTKLLETALLFDGGIIAVVGLTGWLMGWEGWRPFGTALMWIGIATLVAGVISALFAPGREGRRRPKIPPLGDAIMWLMLLAGIMATVVGMALRRL